MIDLRKLAEEARRFADQIPSPGTMPWTARVAAALEAAADVVDAMENLQNQPHRLRVSDDKWSISHPLKCRDEKGFVRFCEIHDAVQALFEESQAWPEGEHELEDAEVLARLDGDK